MLKKVPIRITPGDITPYLPGNMMRDVIWGIGRAVELTTVWGAAPVWICPSKAMPGGHNSGMGGVGIG